MAPSKEATLARVRNNQRRSRARRKEYIADLEGKLREYEATKSPMDAGVQNRIMRLEWENQKLRSLLKAAGLPQIWMDAYLKLDESEKNNHQPQESRPSTAGISVNASESLVGTISNIANEAISQPNDNPFHMLPIPEDGESNILPWADIQPLFDLSLTSLGSAEPSHTASPPSIRLERSPSSQASVGARCGDECNRPTRGASGDTTSCAVAYQLVLQYNTKGLDMVEIYIRLWNGCRKGKDGSRDCTVDNKVLFDVLDYISS